MEILSIEQAKPHVAAYNLREKYIGMKVGQVLVVPESEWSDECRHPSCIISDMYPKGSIKNAKVKFKKDRQYYILKLKELPE